MKRTQTASSNEKNETFDSIANICTIACAICTVQDNSIAKYDEKNICSDRSIKSDMLQSPE